MDGEEMVCKSSIDVFKHAIGDELAAYLKIRSAEVELRVPELKGQWWSIGPCLFLFQPSDLQSLSASNAGVRLMKHTFL